MHCPPLTICIKYDIIIYMENKRLQQLSNLFSFEIQKINKTDLEEYEGVDKKEIGGRHKKTFCRVNKQLLSSPLERLKNDDGKYITYLGDAVKTGIPQMISSMVKVVNADDIIAEIIGSKLCHYYGLNTCINHAGYTGKADAKKYILLSLDFAREGEEMIVLDDIGFDSTQGASFNIKEFDDMIAENRDYEDIPPEMATEVRNQIALSVLVRDVLFGDRDFCFSHLSLLLNDKANSLKLINYDYEDSLRSKTIPKARKNQLKYFKENFPEVYSAFIEKTKELASQKNNMQIEFKNQFHKQMIDVFFTRAEKVLLLDQELAEDELFDTPKSTPVPEV